MAKQQKIYRVAAVEGRMITHPSSVQTGSLEMLGHEKFIDEKDTRAPYGEPVPSRKFRVNQNTEVVGDTGDGFIRRKILDGDLDYIETLDSFDAPEGSGKKEKALVDATEANKKKRGDADLDTDPTLATSEKGGAAEEKRTALAFLESKKIFNDVLPDEDPNAKNEKAEKADPAALREEKPSPSKGTPKFP